MREPNWEQLEKDFPKVSKDIFQKRVETLVTAMKEKRGVSVCLCKFNNIQKLVNWAYELDDDILQKGTRNTVAGARLMFIGGVENRRGYIYSSVSYWHLLHYTEEDFEWCVERLTGERGAGTNHD